MAEGAGASSSTRKSWVVPVACLMAVVLVAGAAGAARAYESWCERVTPQFVAVPAALQTQSSDDWGSYSTKLAVDLDGTVHPLQPTYDDPQQALDNFEKDDGIVGYLQERAGLPAFGAETVGQYTSAAAGIDRTTAPDGYADDLAELLKFADMYDNSAENAERISYMQCKTGARLKQDSYFMG